MKRLIKILVWSLVLLLVFFIANLFFNQEKQKPEIFKIEETKPVIKEVLPEEEEVEIPKPEKVVKEKIPIIPEVEKEIIYVPETRKEIILPIPKIKEVVKEKEPVAAETIEIVEDAQDIEIPGLIVEETMTRVGYEFYETFCTLWKPPKEGIQGYSISINEKASPSWGSLIQIDVNAKMSPIIVWSDMVRPRSDEIEEAVKKAVEATKEYLSNYEAYQKQLKGADMSGDGIY